MLAKAKQVVFDVDGVLIHPWRFRTYLRTEHGIEPETTQPFFGGPFLECIVGKADLYEELAPYLDGWGWEGSVESFVDVWFKVEDASNTEVLQYAEQLRATGVPCHIATNQELHRTEFLAEHMGFAERFDSLFSSCHLGVAKPDPQYFRKIRERLDVPSSSLILVDDTAANVEAAAELGWQTVLYRGPESLRELDNRLRRVPRSD